MGTAWRDNTRTAHIPLVVLIATCAGQKMPALGRHVGCGLQDRAQCAALQQAHQSIVVVGMTLTVTTAEVVLNLRPDQIGYTTAHQTRVEIAIDEMDTTITP